MFAGISLAGKFITTGGGSLPASRVQGLGLGPPGSSPCVHQPFTQIDPLCETLVPGVGYAVLLFHAGTFGILKPICKVKVVSLNRVFFDATEIFTDICEVIQLIVTFCRCPPTVSALCVLAPFENVTVASTFVVSGKVSAKANDTTETSNVKILINGIKILLFLYLHFL
jgi:hypothetical protein